MYLHFLNQLLIVYSLLTLCFQQELAETATALSVAGSRPVSSFVTAVRQTASLPTPFSIRTTTTASTLLLSPQPVDEINGKIQEVAGNKTAALLPNRSFSNPFRRPMCRRRICVSFPLSLTPSSPAPTSKVFISYTLGCGISELQLKILIVLLHSSFSP